MVGKVDAHGLGGDLIVADGLERAAIGRVDKQHDDGDADADDHERHEGIGEIREAAQQLRAIGDRRERLELDQRADDLGEAERGDGQIVALELQDGQADEVRQPRGEQARQQQRNEHAEDSARRIAEGVLQRLGQGEFEQRIIVLIHRRADAARDVDGGEGIGADQHEARLAEGEQARKAVEQVHRDGDKGIDRALAQNRREHDGHARDPVEQEGEHVDEGDARDGQDRLQREAFFLFHMLLLRLSRSASHRTGPSA